MKISERLEKKLLNEDTTSDAMKNDGLKVADRCFECTYWDRTEDKLRRKCNFLSKKYNVEYKTFSNQVCKHFKGE